MATEKDILNIVQKLKDDRDEWKRKAEDYVGRWSAMVELEIKLRNDIEALKVDAQPIALQNHELRKALGDEVKYMIYGAKESHEDGRKRSDKALALTPTASEKIVAEREGLLEQAWGVIANAGQGNWDLECPLWKVAAERWRDRYFTAHDAARKGKEIGTLPQWEEEERREERDRPERKKE